MESTTTAEQQQHQQLEMLQDQIINSKVAAGLIEQASNNEITDTEDEQVATATTNSENEPGLGSDIGDDDDDEIYEDGEDDDDDLDMDAMIKQANEHYLQRTLKQKQQKQQQQNSDSQKQSTTLEHDGPCGFAASLEQLERQSQHLVRSDIRELRERLEQMEMRQETMDMKLNMVAEILSGLKSANQEADQQSFVSEIESEQVEAFVSDQSQSQCNVIEQAPVVAKQCDLIDAAQSAASDAGSSTSYQSSESDELSSSALP